MHARVAYVVKRGYQPPAMTVLRVRRTRNKKRMKPIRMPKNARYCEERWGYDPEEAINLSVWTPWLPAPQANQGLVRGVPPPCCCKIYVYFSMYQNGLLLHTLTESDTYNTLPALSSRVEQGVPVHLTMDSTNMPMVIHGPVHEHDCEHPYGRLRLRTDVLASTDVEPRTPKDMTVDDRGHVTGISADTQGCSNFNLARDCFWPRTHQP